jgi:hypothetical protein
MAKWEIVIPGVICFGFGIAVIIWAANSGTPTNVPNPSWTESQIIGYPFRLIGEYIGGIALILIGLYLMNKGWKS